MNWYKDILEIQTPGKGLHAFTDIVQDRIHDWGIEEGICFLIVLHTSASLVINENYDPSARVDMEAFMDHLVPESQSWHRHTLEGADDSPAHMRAMITPNSLAIPIDDGRLSLGSWQGIYLFEHRRRGHRRKIQIRCLGM